MIDGIAVVKVPGYYGGVTRIGWLRRVGGDEYVFLPGSRLVWRSSGSRSIDQLADDGPGSDHRMDPPVKNFVQLSRLHAVHAPMATIKAWAKECPRPKNWKSWRSDYEAMLREHEGEAA